MIKEARQTDRTDISLLAKVGSSHSSYASGSQDLAKTRWLLWVHKAINSSEYDFAIDGHIIGSCHCQMRDFEGSSGSVRVCHC